MAFSSRKGITPVIATVMLVSITIATSGTAYLYISDTIDQTAQSGQTLEKVDRLEVDSCYRDQLKTYIVVRNPAKGPINAKQSNVILGGRLLSNYTTTKSKVEPGETFTIVIPPETVVKDQILSVEYGGKRFPAICEYLEGSTIDEAVSEGGGSVSEIILGGNLTPRTGPSYGDLCLGNNCENEMDNEPTMYDTVNDIVNLKGDEVNGSIRTNAIKTDGLLCIGDGCAKSTGTNSLYLTNDTNEFDGTLMIDQILPQNGLCIGSTC